MESVFEILPGEYTIGDDSVPNAIPKHRHRLQVPLWIDAAPVTWAHYEVFVAAGGYQKPELWMDSNGQEFPNALPNSVDQRCRDLLVHAERFRSSVWPMAIASRQQPLTGITWFEASAITRFFGARLPFEMEWEIAMQGSWKGDHRGPRLFNARQALPNSPWSGFPRSASGCVYVLGALQEWTADAFSSTYWRADLDRPGIPWSLSTGHTMVTVRGAAPDALHRHVSYRVGDAPQVTTSHRGFRRMWEMRPDIEVAAAVWRMEKCASD